MMPLATKGNKKRDKLGDKHKGRQDPPEGGHTIQHQGGHLKIALRTPNSTLFGGKILQRPFFWCLKQHPQQLEPGTSCQAFGFSKQLTLVPLVDSNDIPSHLSRSMLFRSSL